MIFLHHPKYLYTNIFKVVHRKYNLKYGATVVNIKKIYFEPFRLETVELQQKLVPYK